MLYRTGRYEDALGRLSATIPLWGGQGAPVNWVFLAMVQQRLGRRAEAQQWLEKATAWMAGGSTHLPWNERLEMQVLLREAEALILPGAR